MTKVQNWKQIKIERVEARNGQQCDFFQWVAHLY